jgi:hypothetical protein
LQTEFSVTDLVLNKDAFSENEKVYKAQECIRGSSPDGSENEFKDIYVTFKRYLIMYNNNESILFVMNDVTTHHKLRETQQKSAVLKTV